MWTEAREFSECEAWLDLLQSARFEATDKAYSELIGGREISYSRGQYPASISFLMKRWKWSEKKVRYFLSKLKKREMITTCNKQGMNVITICKYDEYNSNGNDKGVDKGIGEGVDNINNINELKYVLGELKDELRAELRASVEKLGQARGNKKKKEEENIKKISTIVDAKESAPASQEKSEKSAFDKFNDWLKTDAPDVLKLKTQMTEPQFLKIKEKYDYTQIVEILQSMSNYKELPKKYTSVYLTFLKWAKREYGG